MYAMLEDMPQYMHKTDKTQILLTVKSLACLELLSKDSCARRKN